MSVRSFKSVFMVASCAGAALGCYLVSLRVATERAALEDVETEIVLAQRDLRLLQTEIGTRGRLAQLERWNAKVLALSAPSADQFLNGGFELAKMTAPEHKPAVTAPVVLASAPSEAATNTSVLDDDSDVARPAPQSATGPAALMHQASLKRSVENVPKVVRPAPAPVKPPVATGSKTPPAATKPAAKTVAKAAATVRAAGQQKASAKPKAAVGDPLAPMPAKPSVRKLASVSKASVGKPAVASKSTKDPAKKQ